ncbi:MAG: amidohydrolase family protein, partial [Candidatus Thorarchaeota archaeon]
MKLEADLVVLNANVVTMDPAQPEATALAVKNYKFLAVGTDEDMEELVPTARRVIDLGGKTVIPGIVDAHTHITAAGLRSADIDLSSAKSLGDAKRMISASLMRYRMGQWVRAYGWDESKWPEKRYLTASDLDDISREMPIVADRVDGHLTSVNTAALERLKISPEQEGFLKDSEGRPTGVLRDIEGVHDAIIHTPEEMEEGIRRATRLANSHGMTTVVDNISPGVLRYIRECEARNELTARFVVNVPDSQLVHLTSLGVTSGMGTPLVKIGGVKIFADGSIGARTAALSEPYRDEPGNLG